MKRILFMIVVTLVFSPYLFQQEIIRNPEKPSSPNSGRILKVQEVMRITDEGGEFFFKRPYSLKVAENGNIFMVDAEQFLKFSPEGKFIANLFKQGQGPGEIQSAFIFVLHKDDIYAYDLMGIKIIHMTQEGKLIDEFKFMNRYSNFIGVFNDNFILTEMSWPAIEERTGKLFDVPSSIVLISKAEEVIRKSSSFPIPMYLGPNFSVSWGSFRPILTDDGRAIITAYGEEYNVAVLDPGTLEVLRKFNRKYPRVKRPKREAPPRPSPIKIPEREYEDDIVYVYTFKGNIWVRTSTADKQKGTLFDVFNQEGKYIDCFWLNVSGSLVATHGDYLFIREEKEEGMINIVKYKVLD